MESFFLLEMCSILKIIPLAKPKVVVTGGRVQTCNSTRRPGVGTTLQRHPFSGLVDSAGELLRIIVEVGVDCGVGHVG